MSLEISKLLNKVEKHFQYANGSLFNKVKVAVLIDFVQTIKNEAMILLATLVTLFRLILIKRCTKKNPCLHGVKANLTINIINLGSIFVPKNHGNGRLQSQGKPNLCYIPLKSKRF